MGFEPRQSTLASGKTEEGGNSAAWIGEDGGQEVHSDLCYCGGGGRRVPRRTRMGSKGPAESDSSPSPVTKGWWRVAAPKPGEVGSVTCHQGGYAGSKYPSLLRVINLPPYPPLKRSFCYSSVLLSPQRQ